MATGSPLVIDVVVGIVVVLSKPKPQIGLPLQGPSPQLTDLLRPESVRRELLVAHPDDALQPVTQLDQVELTLVPQSQLLRKGVAASGGATDVNSLASAANSSGGVDTEYGASGWFSTDMPLLMGTPDANGYGVPDSWAVKPADSVRFYVGSKTAGTGAGTEVVAANDYWQKRIGIG